LKTFHDERGTFTELMRKDWKEVLQEDSVVQANVSTTYPGVIRAWHRHMKGQTDYFIVLKGVVKICVYDEETGELDEVVSSCQNLQVVRVPGQFWHGFKVVGDKTAVLLYFTTKLYDYKKPDEERLPWNASTIIPKTINGEAADLRVGKPWDWNYPPHK
jgi:dTDP-4-dehydrorhamnose 3,5-epimerase